MSEVAWAKSVYLCRRNQCKTKLEIRKRGYKKICVLSDVNIATISTQHFVQIFHNSHFGTCAYG